jgi:hypothetical protein
MQETCIQNWMNVTRQNAQNDFLRVQETERNIKTRYFSSLRSMKVYFINTNHFANLMKVAVFQHLIHSFIEKESIASYVYAAANVVSRL